MTENDHLPIELTDHTEDLEKAKNLLSKISKDYKYFRDLTKEKLEKENNQVTEEDIIANLDIPITKRKFLVVSADQILGAIADLSLIRQEESIELEGEYVNKYLQSPKLGKHLFFTHQEKIFAPYDKLKNKCFDLLMKLDPTATIVDQIE